MENPTDHVTPPERSVGIEDRRSCQFHLMMLKHRRRRRGVFYRSAAAPRILGSEISIIPANLISNPIKRRPSSPPQLRSAAHRRRRTLRSARRQRRGVRALRSCCSQRLPRRRTRRHNSATCPGHPPNARARSPCKIRTGHRSLGSGCLGTRHRTARATMMIQKSGSNSSGSRRPKSGTG